MTNVWAIKVNASDSPDFDEVLQKSLTDKSVGIGFGLHVPYHMTTQEQRRNIWEASSFSEKQINYRERMFNMLINELSEGDIVFLCKGKNKILYRSIVCGNYYYDQSYVKLTKEGFVGLPHRIKIKNITKFSATVDDWNHMQTIYKL